jgi:nucleoside-diphosphate-sugar epimerase
MKKKVVITGANGFVGSSLVKFLEKEMQVFPFTRKNSMSEIVDIEPEYIIHCAAEVYNKDLMFDSNVILTYELLELSKNLPSLEHFVYIGSSSEYGRKSCPISEDDVLKPDSIYEGTKACGTMLTRAYGKTYGFMTSIIRPFSLYGPKEPQRKFIPRLYDCFVTNTSMNISPGVHDWIYIDDFVEGIKLVMVNAKETGEYYHFGTGIQHTNLEVFKLFSIVMDKTLDYTLVNTAAGSAGIDSNSWVANAEKVLKQFNWSPKHTLKEGLIKYVNFRQNDRTT